MLINKVEVYIMRYKVEVKDKFQIRFDESTL